jgi:hypothetical protein
MVQRYSRLFALKLRLPSLKAILASQPMHDAMDLRLLWQAVLYRVLQDLQNDSGHAYGEYRDARRWVGEYPSRDFQYICSLAGIDADFLHPRLVKVALATEQRQIENAKRKPRVQAAE